MPNRTTALVAGTVYPSPREEPIKDALVIVAAGRIVAAEPAARHEIPADAERIDCAGLTITAGFWNSHVHFFERKWANAVTIPADELGRQLEEMLTRYGFTTVFDTGSQWTNTRALRDRIESGGVPGPRIFSTGEGLVPPGAFPSDQVLGVMGVMKFAAPEVVDGPQAAAAAKALLDQGVDGIKLFASSPRSQPLPEEAFRAAVDEAHRRGKPVFVHPNSAADVLTAVRGGVDIIAHTTPHSGPWDDAVLRAMRDANVALTPTLTVWKSYARHDRWSIQERIVSTEVGQLRAWTQAGGRVLFGTDLGTVDYDPSEEYALMSAAGMSFREILASLTTAPALQFGLAERKGRVTAGFDADLVVLNGDPSAEIQAFTDVRYTMRAGKLVYGRINGEHSTL